MMFLIDKYFVEAFNKKFGLSLTYSEFKQFYDETRNKKKSEGLVNNNYLGGLNVKDSR